MTPQMNICGPYWADSPINSKCRGPHVKGAGDSQLTKRNVTVKIKKTIQDCATGLAGFPPLLKGAVIIVAERE